ncbi:DUF3072 domain-containing protein [Luteipulveratus flavus]|uniref:DUF3072 domain-containing protein n=1 Tax=Luteipulveratus flavus TaxID=3031728 RepID=A0ABT6CAX4_9MICO|nr:DUF3072 domain-containing protein [Luteipulveratus sp. YIM 133296]MDF8265209.1 DUF3072 domain-containing protein [Luteipulveratus sp. YIM 133296]
MTDNTDPADRPSTDDQPMLGAPTPESTGDGAIKDPDEWVTGDEPMTGAQRSYLDTLAREAGEQIPADLTKAEASEHIERLQGRTSRGTSTEG